jgi:hypothetical protein
MLVGLDRSERSDAPTYLRENFFAIVDGEPFAGWGARHGNVHL